MSTDLTASPPFGAELRQYTETLLSRLPVPGAVPPAPPAFLDVEEDWLPAAVEALVAILTGEDSLEPLSRAAARDPRNTALFLCLALSVAGQGDRIHASWLGNAFGEVSMERPVTHGQRALWIAAARGAYGPAGKIFVLRKLDSQAVLDPSDAQLWLQALVPGEVPVDLPPSLVDFPDLADLPDLARPMRAAAVLARLRARCTEITSTPQPVQNGTDPQRRGADQAEKNGTDPQDRGAALNGMDPQDGGVVQNGTDPQDRGAARNGTDPLDRGAVRNGTDPQDGDVSAVGWAEDEPLAVLRILSGLSGRPAPARSLTDHLLDDLRPGSDPLLAAIALHVAAPVLRGVAEELAVETRITPPDPVTVPLLGHALRLNPEGPDPDSLAAAETAIIATGVRPRRRPWGAYLLIVLGVVAMVCGIIARPLAVAGVALAGLGGWGLVRRRKALQRDATYVAAKLTELKEVAEGTVWALHAYAREADELAEVAESDGAEVMRLLRRGPRAA